MGFLQKVHTLVKAEANSLLDKVIDMNSIPMIRQYVRDLEDGIARTEHESAVAKASVTTATRQIASLQKTVEYEKQIVQAYLAKGDESSARTVAGQIHSNTEELAALNSQLETATTLSNNLASVVEKLNAKHQTCVNQLRTLELKDRTAKSMSAATSSLKGASNLMSNDVNSSIDNISRKIDERLDVANTEFSQVAGKFDEPADPLKDAAVDDILNSLRPTATSAGA